MNKSHISAFEALEAVLVLKTERYDFSDFSGSLLSVDELFLSKDEILEEIHDLFLLIFRTRNVFETALIVLSASYKGDSVGLLANFYLKTLRECSECS